MNFQISNTFNPNTIPKSRNYVLSCVLFDKDQTRKKVFRVKRGKKSPQQKIASGDYLLLKIHFEGKRISNKSNFFLAHHYKKDNSYNWAELFPPQTICYDSSWSLVIAFKKGNNSSSNSIYFESDNLSISNIEYPFSGANDSGNVSIGDDNQPL